MAMHGRSLLVNASSSSADRSDLLWQQKYTATQAKTARETPPMIDSCTNERFSVLFNDSH